jgi:hypothetical protein
MLPAAERLLLGPGPSLISPRVMRAMSATILSHLQDLAAVAREAGALVVVDAATSLGAMPLDVNGMATGRGIQLQSEGTRRAVGRCADRVHEASAGQTRAVPQLLLRYRAARGLLGAPQIWRIGRWVRARLGLW